MCYALSVAPVGESTTIYARIPLEMRRTLNRVSKETGKNLSELIREALEKTYQIPRTEA